MGVPIGSVILNRSSKLHLYAFEQLKGRVGIWLYWWLLFIITDKKHWIVVVKFLLLKPEIVFIFNH